MQSTRSGPFVAALVVSGMAAGLATPAPAASQADSLELLAERITQAVVLLDVTTAAGSRQGSGFLVHSSGQILTNEHVIRDARAIRVRLASGDVYDVVDILAVDDRRDIAVIRVPGFNLPALPLGDSDSVRIGANVVLVGSPLGLENTVTTGIISARRQEPEGYRLFQVSAPASQGSSGGPLLSLDGEVLGIASSQMRTGQNLNFAVPINYARGLLQNLDDQPIEMLRPTAPPSEESAVALASEDRTVNSTLRFELPDFAGYGVQFETRMPDARMRRTRITYRVIETVGQSEPRLERYMESETSRRTEPFGTYQTVQRERVRTLVTLQGLESLSTRGERSSWTADGWRTASYDLRFEDGRVVGLVTDTTGRAEELDRNVPDGVVLREMGHLAFTSIASDTLVGKSVELVTFDPWVGGVVEERYDLLELTEVEIGGETRSALRVNIASGLSNATAYFGVDRPGLLLRRVSGDGSEVGEMIVLEDTGGGG